MKTSCVPVLFAAIALVFGTALVFLTPPFQIADEFSHFFRAYQVSLGQFVAQTRYNTQGGVLPVSLLKLSGRFADLPYHHDQKTSLRKILDARQIPLDPDRKTFCYFPVSANYTALVYAPQALAIAVGRWTGLRPLGLFYLGREAALITWTVAGYFTLRLAPALGWAIMLLMLMPMSLASAASVSADGITNAICLLFTALVWRQSVGGNKIGPHIDAANRLAVFALSIGVTLCKFAYLPLVLLVLLIPLSRLGGKERWGKFVVGLIVVNLFVSFAWLRVTAGTGLVLRPDRPDVNVSRQLAFLESHPMAFFPATARGLAGDGTFLLHSFIGYLGWLDNPVSPVVVWLYWLALIFACWPIEGDPPAPARWHLAVVAASICASTLIFAMFDYLGWTPVGSSRVSGVQGRYFIPLGAALFILVWGTMRRCPKAIPPLPNLCFGRLGLMATAVCGCGCFYTLFLVYRRYYVTG